MGKETGGEDKRERTLKPERDDLTDYQLLNSMGGAGVRGQAKATPSDEPAGQQPAGEKPDRSSAPSGEAFDYNDNVDVAPVDTDGETNS